MAKNNSLKKIYIIVGTILLIAGLICVTIGLYSFFSSFNNGTSPKLFFLCFIGGPIFFVGLAFLLACNLKNINHYISNQTIDTKIEMTNRYLDGTQKELGETVSLIKDQSIICPNCKACNSKGSKYCNKCGSKLTKLCPNCNTENEIDSKYCSNCGHKF
mgnify:FL=1